jgi:ribonuclease HII
VAEIERLNILQASLLAMRRALEALNIANEDIEIWVDGNQNPKFENIAPARVKCFIGGDALHAPISAASVIAKVTRDRMMHELHARYPHYGWDKNMGYGSATHRAAIIAHGPCPEHRTLFLRKIYDRNPIAA